MLIKPRFYPLRDENDPGGTGAPATPAAPTATVAAKHPVLDVPDELVPDSWKDHVRDLRREHKKLRETQDQYEADIRAANARITALTEAEAKANAASAETQAKANDRIIRAELKAEAIKAGMVDLDGLKLADLSAVKLDDKGEVVGAADLMKALKEAKPYLFGQAQSTTQTQTVPPKKEDPKPFDARTATDEERAAKAKELGLNLKKR